MRFAYTVERASASTRLGLRYSGCGPSSMPLVIVAIIPNGLIDLTNRWNARGSGPIVVLKENDIILSINGSSKETHGMDVVRKTLWSDRVLVFEILRPDPPPGPPPGQEYDPWDINLLGSCPPAAPGPPPGRAPGPPRGPPPGPPLEMLVDPLCVRFTHDKIRSVFRNGKSLDDTIVGLLEGRISKYAFRPIEVSRDTIGIG